MIEPNVSRKMFHTPLGHAGVTRLIAHTKEARHEQLVAATAAGALASGGVATHRGNVQFCYLLSSIAAASGESMVVDVLKNGVSILSSAYTFDSTKSAETLIPLAVSPNTSIDLGDILTVSRTYTAGGTPTMTATVVGIGWAPESD